MNNDQSDLRKILEYLGMNYYSAKSIAAYLPEALVQELLYTLTDVQKPQKCYEKQNE